MGIFNKKTAKMNGVINSVIEYFRSLAFSHTKIKGYKTGESFDSNEDFQEYPVLWLRLPIATNYSSNNVTEIDTYLPLTITLGVYTKKYTDVFGNEHTIALQDTALPTNEIEQIEPLVRNQMLDDCTRYINHIITKLIDDVDNNKIPALYTSFQTETVDNSWDDKVVGVEATFVLRWYNQYKCEADDYFTQTQNN